MSLKFNCPRCRTEIIARYGNRGDTIRCTQCGTLLAIPAEAREFDIHEVPFPTSGIPAGVRNHRGPAVEPAGAVDPRLVGIRGILLLPGLGMILWPIRGIIDLIQSLGVASEAAVAGVSVPYYLEIMVQVGVLGMVLYTSILFFSKSRKAPSVYIALMLVNILGSLIEYGLMSEIPDKCLNRALIWQLAQSIGSACIWIPYFMKSERVRATFIN